MVPSDTAGINLFVRNKRRADLAHFTPDNTILFVAGSTYPASTSFDLQLDGFSWMDHLADQGYDVYLVDVRGYGRSTRPGSRHCSFWPPGHTRSALQPKTWRRRCISF